MYPRLAVNILCSQGLPWTPNLPASSAGITGVYQTQINLCLFTQWSNKFSRLYGGYMSWAPVETQQDKGKEGKRVSPPHSRRRNYGRALTTFCWLHWCPWHPKYRCCGPYRHMRATCGQGQRSVPRYLGRLLLLFCGRGSYQSHMGQSPSMPESHSCVSGSGHESTFFFMIVTAFITYC